MNIENNRYRNPYQPAPDWDQTPDGPVVMDQVMTTRDIIPLVRQLYGIQDMDNNTYQLCRNWARNNPNIAACFFTEENLTAEARNDLGY